MAVIGAAMLGLSLIALVVLTGQLARRLAMVVCIIGLGIGVGGVYLNIRMLENTHNVPSRASAASKAPSDLSMPPGEVQFIGVVAGAQLAYGAADGDAARSAVQASQRDQLCAMRHSIGTIPEGTSDIRVKDWVGTLESQSISRDGKGAAVITIANNITIGTSDSAAKSGSSDIFIDPASNVFRSVTELMPGDEAVFSGELINDDKDCIKSLSSEGSQSVAAFLFRFESIRKK
jgi:hypothetical protein